MGSEIVRHDETGDLPAILQVAKTLVKAGGLLPNHLKNEGEIAAVILAGRELGIPPMASIRGLRLIQGNVTLDAALQLGCMIRAGAKITWEKDGSDGEAILLLERSGQQPHRSRYTLDMARRAGLTGGNWTKHPAAMLRARCVTAAGRAYFPDVLSGVSLPDELDDAQPQTPARRTLDDVAPPALQLVAPDPQVELVAGPADETDEYGLPIPGGDCPVIGKGKQHEGKSWLEIPEALVEKFYTTSGAKMTANQRNWAEYIIARRAARKAAEAAEQKAILAAEAAEAAEAEAEAMAGQYE